MTSARDKAIKRARYHLEVAADTIREMNDEDRRKLVETCRPQERTVAALLAGVGVPSEN